MHLFLEILTFTLIFIVAIPFLASMLCGAAGMWLCTLPLRRLRADAHWSEMARAYWPARTAASLITIWSLTIACFSQIEGTATGSIALTAASVIAGCLCGCRLAHVRLNLPAGAGLKRITTLPARWLLFPGGPAMLSIMTLTLRKGITSETIAIACIAVLVVYLLIAGGSVALLKALRIVRPAEMETQQLARGLAAAGNVPLRGVLRMDLGMANAFAFGWTRELGVTDAALAILEPDELRSVMAHEIGHLREDLKTRLLRLVGLPAIALIGLAPAAFLSGQPLIGLGLYFAYIALTRWSTRIYRRLEVSADHHAHSLESSEGVYARALEKIHRAGLIPAVLPARNPYPSLYDRMKTAGVIPDFPRPAPPARIFSMVVSAVAAVAFYLLWNSLNEFAWIWWAARP